MPGPEIITGQAPEKSDLRVGVQKVAAVQIFSGLELGGVQGLLGVCEDKGLFWASFWNEGWCKESSGLTAEDAVESLCQGSSAR